MNILRVTLYLMLGLCAATALARSHGHHHHAGKSGHFDYYVMSLSWAPSFCQTHPGERIECGSKGFGFVLHGLWPQNRNGSWQQHCSTRSEPDHATIERTLAFMPSPYLIRHEWETHGSCTGLDPANYFKQADRAFASIHVPRELQTPGSPPSLSANDIVHAFMQANPGLHDNMISVACRDGNALSEVRICLDKRSLEPQACGGRVRNTCRYGMLRIPAAR